MPNPVLPRVAREDMNEAMRQGYDTAKEIRDDATFFEIGVHAPEAAKKATGKGMRP